MWRDGVLHFKPQNKEAGIAPDASKRSLFGTSKPKRCESTFFRRCIRRLFIQNVVRKSVPWWMYMKKFHHLLLSGQANWIPTHLNRRLPLCKAASVSSTHSASWHSDFRDKPKKLSQRISSLKKSSGSCSISLRRRRTNSDITLGFDRAKSPQEHRRATKFFQCSNPCKDCRMCLKSQQKGSLSMNKCRVQRILRTIFEMQLGFEREIHRDRKEKNEGELQLPQHFHPVAFKVLLNHFLGPLTSVHVVLAETLLNGLKLEVRLIRVKNRDAKVIKVAFERQKVISSEALNNVGVMWGFARMHICRRWPSLCVLTYIQSSQSNRDVFLMDI